MNRKLNIVLNIVEMTSVILVGIFMILLAHISIEGLNETLQILKNILFILTIISEIIIISIEVLLFAVYNRNVKFIYLGYLAIELVSAVITNMFISFSGIFVIILFEIGKTYIRLNKEKKLYNRTLFRRYCKLFNIKLSTAQPKRKKKRKKVKAIQIRKSNVSNKTSYA